VNPAGAGFRATPSGAATRGPRRPWSYALPVLGLVVVVVALLSSSVGSTSASLVDTSKSSVAGGADTVTRYLHVYSQSTDPDGLTGYYSRQGATPAQPAATGSDFTLSANLGGVGLPDNLTATSVFTVAVVSPLPRSLANVTVAATLVADAGTGLQPLRKVSITDIDGTSGSASRVLTAGQKVQFTVGIHANGSYPADTQLIPHVLITVTYSGFSTTYYQYDVPVKVYTGTGAGPN
jgi:hypothetical protein